MRRLVGILLVALCLSPGLVWRDNGTIEYGPRPLAIAALPLPTGEIPLGRGLVLAHAWHLSSRSYDFGGYSALLTLPDAELLAVSDRGYFLRFAQPDGPVRRPAMGAVGDGNTSDKRATDIESATRDRASGALWLGYENTNAIRRFDAALTKFEEVRPHEMAAWPFNTGPESLVRLRDGRFIVLREAVSGSPRPWSEGLLFAGDPVAGARARAFRFVPPEGFRSTDIAQLPDGRVLILLRRLELVPWPRFASRLAVADPAAIEAGQDWPWQPLAEIAAPLPAENYEGLAVEPRGAHAVRLWLISDDNRSTFQRTLLLALDWDVPGK